MVLNIVLDSIWPSVHRNEPFVPRVMEQDDLRIQVLELAENLTKSLSKKAQREKSQHLLSKENISGKIHQTQTKINYSIKDRILE